MRRMKDSGIAWIGEIPEEWLIQRMKNIATIARGGSPRPIEDYLTDDEDSLNWIKIGDTIKGYKFIDKVQQKIRIDGLSKTRLVHKGDLVLTNSMSFGEPYILNIDGCIHDGWVCFQNVKINIIFLYYLLCSQLCIEQFILLTSGGVVQNLNVEKIGSITIFMPLLPEQHRIADYLDAKCTEIDRSMELARQGMDKLKAYRMSVITEAVTKGLDPDVPMKDSGVPWIGEIPEGWAIQRMKNIATIARGGSPRPIEDYLTDDEGGLNWIKIGDTIKGYKFIDKVQQKIRIDGLSKTRFVHKGDLVLTNSMSFGEPYILNIDGCIHDGWVCFQNVKINIIFLYYLLCSQLCIEQFILLTSGGVVQNLNIEKIGSITIFMPPLSEQHRIASYLDAKCAEIDAIIARKQELLDKLAAYKKSLIFECVTGKREVAA